MKTCCFIGHRRIDQTQSLYVTTQNLIKALINADVTTFLFGSNSQFIDMCYQIVTALKADYPQIIRIYVRAEQPNLTESSRAFCLMRYEHTYFSEKAKNARMLSYIKRNEEMIEKSDICIAYYDNGYQPKQDNPVKKNSGTQRAYAYAIKKEKQVINYFPLPIAQQKTNIPNPSSLHNRHYGKTHFLLLSFTNSQNQI